jgi:hypothetical protein
MEQQKAPALNPGLVRLAEFVRNVHVVEVPPAVPVASVLDPEYWAHCTKKFKQYDRIECRAQDNSWLADLMVAKIEAKGVRMWAINFVDLNVQAAERSALAEPEQTGDYAVSFAPKHQWRVVRLSDKEVIHKDEPTREAAQAWLVANLATLA